MTEQEKRALFLTKVDAVFDAPVTEETTVRADLNATSMQCFMILGIMKELGAKGLQYQDIKKCVTIGDIADLMIEKSK